MATSNLNITEVASSQNQKEVTINEGLENLDLALTSFVEKDLTTSVVLTSTELTRNILIRANNTGVGSVLTVPNLQRLFAIHNASTENTLSVARGTTSVEIAVNSAGFFYTDGTENGLVRII